MPHFDIPPAFPDMRGFSPRNLKYMRAFAEAWPGREFVQAVLAQLPYGHTRKRRMRYAGISAETTSLIRRR